MPITPQFSWEDTEELLTVSVRFTGVSRARIDVFATECLLKVNAPPYFFQADLHGEIDDSQTSATVDSAGVTFRAIKRRRGKWGTLMVEGLSKDDIIRRRVASIEAAHTRLEEARKRKLDERKRYEKDLTHQTFDIDAMKRREVERLKELELDRERRRVGISGALGGDDESEEEEAGWEEGGEEDKAMPDHPDYHGRGWRRGEAGEEHERWPEKHVVRVGEWDDEDEGSAEDKKGERSAGERTEREERRENVKPVVLRPLPPPRQKAEAVRVDFTSLQTPHLPAREKREKEIAEYRRRREAGPQLDEPNDIAERQPMFLKDKGDALFSKGNYQAALNAYTRAVELDGRIAVCFANRSACHLKLGMHKHCLMDCDRALELLSNAGEPAAEADGAQAADAGESEGGKAAPEGAGPREGDPEGRAEAKARRMRVKVLCRRAKAKAALGDAAGALADLRAAGGLDPADESIQKSIEDAVLAQGAMDYTAVMELGQKRFKAGAYDGASEAFQSAADLASGPGTEEAAALAARAAALLQLGRFRATVDDCTQSLRALVRAARALGMAAQGGELEASGDPLGMLREMGAPGAWGGGEKEGLVLMKAVGRRAVALGHLRQYEEAWRDFSSLGELYRAANMEDRARAAEDDGARMMRLWKEEELAGDKGASKGEERAAPQALTASEGA